MNKAVKTYLISWAIFVAAFNAVVFIAPGWAGADKYTGSFWAGYGFTMFALIAHIIITIWALRDSDSSRKLFYNIPIIYLSYTAMVVSIIVGALCMLNSNMPVWIAITVALVLTVFYAGAILKTKIAIDAIDAVDVKTKTETSFIRNLTSQASALKADAKTEDAKAACEKVYEALRYSNPRSSGATADIEKEIAAKFDEFSQAVKAGDGERIGNLAVRIDELVGERKKNCL